MKRSSSTSASSRLPLRFLATFFGIVIAVFWGVNFAVLKAHKSRRYRPDSEYARKMRNALEAYASGRRLTTVFAGDSTISVGIMPRLLGPGYQNVAWSGFDPSELELLKENLLSLPVVPTVVFLGINPTFLSQNDWGDTLSVPPGTAFVDGIGSFYDDTNSFKPLVIMGGLAALSNRFLVSPLGRSESDRGATVKHLSVEPDGLLVVDPETGAQMAPRDDLKLPFRQANFEMIEAFHHGLARKGIRVVWLFMPYSAMFERALSTGISAREFVARYRGEIHRIFGEDLIDLTGTIPDEFFRDEGHLRKAGARLLTGKLSERLASIDTAARGAQTISSTSQRPGAAGPVSRSSTWGRTTSGGTAGVPER
jgi:hypothetical protein